MPNRSKILKRNYEKSDFILRSFAYDGKLQ